MNVVVHIWTATINTLWKDYRPCWKARHGRQKDDRIIKCQLNNSSQFLSPQWIRFVENSLSLSLLPIPAQGSGWRAASSGWWWRTGALGRPQARQPKQRSATPPRWTHRTSGTRPWLHMLCVCVCVWFGMFVRHKDWTTASTNGCAHCALCCARVCVRLRVFEFSFMWLFVLFASSLADAEIVNDVAPHITSDVCISLLQASKARAVILSFYFLLDSSLRSVTQQQQQQQHKDPSQCIKHAVSVGSPVDAQLRLLRELCLCACVGVVLSLEKHKIRTQKLLASFSQQSCKRDPSLRM